MKTVVVLLCIIFSGAWSSLAQQPPDEFSAFIQERNALMRDYWKAGEYTEAIALLKEMHARYEALDPAGKQANLNIDVTVLYNLACGYALIDSVEQALWYLNMCVEKGFTNYANMKQDTDLKALHETETFQKLLEIVRERGDHLYKLRKAGPYRASAPVRPTFTYQPASDSNLVRLRTMYNLDSIAGTGDELSRIIRLMQWAHGIVRHDGNSKNPSSRNAVDLIAVCTNENRGVNCRMMATILNEAYLAMGFRSRHITCMPKDTTDPDCHVINSVYSTTLRKWVWMDPTFAAYMSDETGALLSIPEVRARMIAGDSLRVADGINWNGQPKPKAEYLDYMAKNLYWFTAPAPSEYGYESQKGKRVYVNLLPAGYNPHEKLLEAMNEKGGYYTNDAGYFWESGEEGTKLGKR